MQHFQVKYHFITKLIWKQLQIAANMHNWALAMASMCNPYAEKYKQNHYFSEISERLLQDSKAGFLCTQTHTLEQHL